MIDSAGSNGLGRHPENNARGLILRQYTSPGSFEGLNALCAIVSHPGEHYAYNVSASVRCGRFEGNVSAGAVAGNSWAIIQFYAAGQ